MRSFIQQEQKELSSETWFFFFRRRFRHGENNNSASLAGECGQNTLSPPSDNNAPVSTQVSSHGGARVTEVWAFLSQAGQHGGDVGELLHDRAALSC